MQLEQSEQSVVDELYKEKVITPSIKARATSIMKIGKGESDDSVQGYDRFGYYIDISREHNNEFYILVLHPDGSSLYDGYFGTPETTLREAVIDAVHGALLVVPKKQPLIS